MSPENTADAPDVFGEKTGSTAALGQGRPISGHRLPEPADEVAALALVAVLSNN